MAVPSQSEIMIPLLEMVSHGEEYRLRDMEDALGDRFFLTAEERTERVESGDRRFFKNCAFAQTQLKKMGLLESIRRGYHKITEKGREELRKNAGTPPNETEETGHGIARKEQRREKRRENLAAPPNVTEEAVRRIVREELQRVKDELKSALRETIDKV